MPLILVDGTHAGQVHHIPQDSYAWNVADPYTFDFRFRSLTSPYLATSTYTQYRVERCGLYYPDSIHGGTRRLALHLGLSQPGEPDEETLLRLVVPALNRLGMMDTALREWLRYRLPAERPPDQPIRILCPGAETLGHDATVRISSDQAAIQGFCSCGWLTETVARGRREREVMDLADAHRDQGNARAVARLLADVERYGEAPGARQSTATTGPGLPPNDNGYMLASDRDWPADGKATTCAHVCGADPDHTCDAKAATALTFTLPSGGKRHLPLCGPCHQAETAAAAGAILGG